VALKKRVVDSPEIRSVIGQVPALEGCMHALYECKYKEFFRVRCAWRGVAWRGVAWRGVAWRGVAWRGVAWRACCLRSNGIARGSLLSCGQWMSRRVRRVAPCCALVSRMLRTRPSPATTHTRTHTHTCMHARTHAGVPGCRGHPALRHVPAPPPAPLHARAAAGGVQPGVRCV
jgi:hypothetical protein